MEDWLNRATAGLVPVAVATLLSLVALLYIPLPEMGRIYKGLGFSEAEMMMAVRWGFGFWTIARTLEWLITQLLRFFLNWSSNRSNK